MLRSCHALVIRRLVVFVLIVVVIALILPASAAAEAAIMTAGKSVALELVYYITQQAPLLIRKANSPPLKRLFTSYAICSPAKLKYR